MVAQQKIKDSSPDCATEIGVCASPTSVNKMHNPGSPKSRLAKLKRSSTKAKTNATAANDPFRFQGNGVDFKGKMIGEREVGEARGDMMCAEAMRLCKASVKSTGSHKQRIVLNISIEGLKIKDEKSGSVFYNFPVAKISFIARDTTDARAFGFIFGTNSDKYKFYGIKTAQTADHAVLSIRDMFQVVFEMKKKQIMEVKQKQEEQENMEREHAENGGCRIEDGVAVADLLDLESELQNLEQGFNQLQNIPSMPEDDAFAWTSNGVVSAQQNDPFGDSFNPNPVPVFAPTLNGWPSGGSNGSGMSNGQNGHHQTYSGTNPFAMLSQQQPSSFNGNGMMAGAPPAQLSDPFDTQSAHRLIHAINNAHVYPAPPLPMAPPVCHLPSAVPTQVDWGLTSNGLKENKAPNGVDFAANFTTESNGVDKQKWEEPKRVTTLEEAFSKLVDMNQLVSSTNNTVAARKNPFEHIINPPKMALNALAATGGTPPSMGHNSAVVQSCMMANGHSNGAAKNGSPMGIRAGDPFNDDFFN